MNDGIQRSAEDNRVSLLRKTRSFLSDLAGRGMVVLG